MFNSDQPIQNSGQDLLGRSPFAFSLGESLLNYKDIDSVAIGLFGAWGSGKTSILNMTLEYIQAKSLQLPQEQRPITIRFNPWNFSDQNQLIRQFFKQVSSAVKSKDYAGNLKNIGEYLESYAAFFEPLAMIPSIGPIALIVSKITKYTGKGAKNLGKLKANDLEAIKSKLNNLLIQQNRKIIVVIDDIDRLSNTEIRQVFQLVKSLGDFKNTIYILSFDKAVVINALSKVQEGVGLEYLEKVIQVPFDIPLISLDDVHSFLFSQLNDLIKDIPDIRWDSNHWGNIWHAGLKNLFGNLRDVTRYVNSLRFTFPIVKSEVDPVDFLAITALQIFLPDIFYGIRDNKDIFVGILESTYAHGDERKKEDKARVDEIIGRQSHFEKRFVQKLLIRLFPRLEALFGNVHYGYDSLSDWRRECRISSPDIFDVYFRLSIPKGELSQKELEAIISKTGDRVSFTTALLSLCEDERIIRLLERMEDYTEEGIPETNIRNIVCVLLDIGDRFPPGDSGHFTFDTPTRILRIINQLTRRVPTQEERFLILRDAIESSTQSIYILVDEITLQDQEHGRLSNSKKPKPTEDCNVNSEQLDELEKMVVTKIIAWAKSGKLISHPYLITILSWWKARGDNEELQQYISATTETDEGLISFITRFLYQSTSYSGSDFVGRVHQNLNYKGIQDFLPISSSEGRIREILSHAHLKDLDKDQKLALQLLIDTLDGKVKSCY